MQTNFLKGIALLFLTGMCWISLVGCTTSTEPPQTMGNLTEPIIKERMETPSISATSLTQIAYPSQIETLPTASPPYPGPISATSPPRVAEIPTPDCVFVTKPSGASLTEEMSINLALQWLYGDSGCINLAKQEVYVESIGLADLKHTIIKPLVSGFFEQDGLPKFILLTEGIYLTDCHPCGAKIGGVVFVKRDGAWLEETRNDHIVETGSFGRAPKGQLMQIGADQYGVVIRSTYTSTGNSAESTFVIAYLNGKLSFLNSITTAEAEVVRNSWSYTSTLEFIPGEQLDFYDLKIVSVGTKYIEHEISQFEEVRIYTLQDDNYILQESRDN